MTPEGLALLKRFEGLRLDSYRDPVGILTVGYGHTGPDVAEGMRITELEAERLLLGDVRTAQDAISSLVQVPLSESQKDALTSLVFNIGPGGFAKSTLLKKLNAGDLRGAANEFLRWDKAGGQVLAGLTKRRMAERDLFISELPIEKPMLPFVAAALPAIISAVPDLVKIFGDRSKESTTQYAQAAEKVVEIAIQATGASNAQEAAEKVKNDPKSAEMVREAVKGQWYELVGASEQTIERARKFATEYGKDRTVIGRLTFIEVLSLVFVAMSSAGGGWVLVGNFPAEMKGAVITLMLIAGFTGVKEFWFGSSRGSERKTELLGK